MNLTGKLLIALIVGAAAYGIHFLAPALNPAILIFAASLGTALLTSISPGTTAATESAAPVAKTARGPEDKPDLSGPREEGEVKWFNVSKGFGFITKDDGEEIFVHFRSIRGEGRRSLQDGQRVSFVEAQSDKGPQAEDVVGL